jgi:hypothetical protein
MNRASIPEAARRRRSRIAQLAHNRRLLRGTLSVRNVICGKASCRCAGGEPHTGLYLTQSKSGKTVQLYVPKRFERRVRQAIDDYQELQRLIEELSEQEWKLLRKRKD